MSMTPEAAESFVECFNKHHPPGTPVVVIKDHGEQVETTTRSVAGIISENLPVISLKGISGCYDLGRVIVRTPEG